MKSRRGGFGLLACGILLLLLSFCTGEYNPFADPSNARAIPVYASFDHGDTIEIFQRETLRVALAVSPLLDSFSLKASGNRLLKADTTIVPPATAKTPVQYEFVFSYPDTGWHAISLYSHADGNTTAGGEYRLYCQSPLQQQSVTGSFESVVELETEPVQDNDVIYHWQLGNLEPIHSVGPSAGFTIPAMVLADSGQLWVTDSQGGVRSPSSGFLCLFRDELGPVILCANKGFEGRDTVWSGSSVLYLRVNISDQGRGGAIRRAVIDGEPFDWNEGAIYAGELDRLDTLHAPRSVVIEAEDLERNVSSKTLYIGYDSLIGVQRESVVLSIIAPAENALQYSTRRCELYGKVENLTGRDLSVSYSINQTPLADTSRIDGSLRVGEWGAVVSLPQRGINQVAVTVLDSAHNAVTDTAVFVVYDPTHVDTNPPRILEITSNNRSIDSILVADTSIAVEAIVVDEGTGVAQVLVDGAAMVAQSRAGSYRWSQTLSVSHSFDGNLYTFVAIDSNGLADTARAVVFHNNLPTIMNAPSPPSDLVVGQRYRDFIQVSDKDTADQLRIVLASGPQGFTLRQQGNVAEITWVPDRAMDTAAVIVVHDGMGRPVDCRVELHVSESGKAGGPVFSTTAADFPAFVEAGNGRLDLPLSVMAESGTPPLDFRVEAAPQVSAQVRDSNQIVWTPAASADTGYVRMRCIVTDHYGLADTIHPALYLVPPNRPCILQLESSPADTLPDGTIGYHLRDRASLLGFRIVDPDPPVAEHHRVSVRFGAAAVVSEIDTSGSFTVEIDTSALRHGYDTLHVFVSDRAGHTDKKTLRFYFGPVSTVQPGAQSALARIGINTLLPETDVGEDLFGFPLLVRFDAGTMDFSRLADESSLLFKKSDGTVVPHQAELWDPAGQVGIVWIRIDTLRAGSNQSVYLHRNPDTGGGALNPFPAESGFLGVWHCSDSFAGSDTTDGIRDASPRQNHGTARGRMGSHSSVEGVVGGAIRLDGADDWFDMGDRPEFDVSAYTYSFWVQGDHTPSTQATSKVFCVEPRRIEFAWDHVGPGSSAGQLVRTDSDDDEWVSTQLQIPMTANTWYHVTGTYDGSAIRLYVDGEVQDSVHIAAGLLDATGLAIGADTEMKCCFFAGVVDEIRFCNEPRSPGWIRLMHENQRPGSGFPSVEVLP